ncbi:hypothetical protein BH09SUM1_BH09SUM1_14280 [soil metagenome]
MSARVIEVRPEDGHILYLKFQGGVEGRVSVAARVNLGSGVATPLADPKFFRHVALDGPSIAWPNGYDICPDLLHAWARGLDVPEWSEAMSRVAEDPALYDNLDDNEA